MSIEALITALMSGFSDSLTPPRLAAGALAAFFLFVFRDEKWLSFRFFFGFISGHLVAASFLRAGEIIAGFLTVRLFAAAACFYAGIGLLLIVAGAYFARQWYCLYRPLNEGQESPLLKFNRGQGGKWRGLFAVQTGFCLGVCFAFFAFTWPTNIALRVLSSHISLPGLLWPTVWCLFIYESVIALVLTGFFVAVRYCFDEERRRLLSRRRSLLLSVAAGVYMSLGVCLVIIYIQQLF